MNKSDHFVLCYVLTGRWRQEEPLLGLEAGHHGRAKKSANTMREQLSRWFHTPEGQVPWQERMMRVQYEFS